ncbi:MAG TPA: glycosyltransferase N-terminal domain-containing protein [Gemmatimonadaceae bacterium]|nr:glycosyltransferase N-terminal domain-containing protein [Gemmatimonadaceae bacterium]
MRLLLRWLYAVAARLATVAGGVVPAGDSKTAIAIHARRGLRVRYRDWASAQRDRRRPLLWAHAPSVGEGLQARPVLSLVRERRPSVQLAYTYFSPSAVEFARSLDVDFTDYLPFDDAREMRAAIDALAPTALVFSKLDVWPTLVREARRAGVRVGMISATLGASSGRRGGAASLLLRDAYAALDAVGAVDPADADRLVELGVRREVIEITGDTRFDQVWLRAERLDRDSRLLRQLQADRPTVVAGSTWPSDEAHLLPAFRRVREHVPAARLVIAPHELSAEHLGNIESWARESALKLERVDGATSDADVVLVDRFGILGDLYALADVAFVGGGFHAAGLHSVLEPAAFGAPVLFGPKRERSRDALVLEAARGGRSVTSSTDIEAILREWLNAPDARKRAGDNARAMVDAGRGAAERSFALVDRLLS